MTILTLHLDDRGFVPCDRRTQTRQNRKIYLESGISYGILAIVLRTLEQESHLERRSPDRLLL